MSGLLKGIGKVFKKIGKFVKKNWKYVAMAVAVYFTAGVALSYFGATAGFAASMPQFGAGGMFTSAASAIGFNGPAVAGAAMEMGAGALSASGAAMTSSEMLAAFVEATPHGMTGAQMAEAWAAGQVSVASAAGNAGGYTVSIAGHGNTVAQVGTKVGAKVGASVSQSPVAQQTGSEMVMQSLGQGALPNSPAVTGQTALQVGGQQMTGTEMIAKSMSTTAKLGLASTALNIAAGLAEPQEEDPIAFGVGRKGQTEHGWDGSESEAFSNMNKRGGVPKGSAYAKAEGGSQFLKTAFDAGKQDYNPQVAKEFIAQNA